MGLSGLWTDVYDRVVPCMSAASVDTLGGPVLTDAMVVDVLHVHSNSSQPSEVRELHQGTVGAAGIFCHT